ncbi:tRNA N(3)-methylcytidine methyltransferase METTL2-like isoform X2 [Paramacrobiotus metropolitanus]|uniref:tRNA N(3)-methylcytidine methyltransferase METTL2-like isoform X2 n=1 Tax=Paramacrobiotus metropolitanus TaxID=2943436 RepID=UPI0024461E7E|nr:tRNA N(3)-methylcytidine methyltransferase METTL2-like isoform X2 [Paramacrobiotus metropolitanus]
MDASEASSLKRIERVRNRTLEDPSKVFEKNAWDDVCWDEEQLKNAEVRVLANSAEPLPESESSKFLLNADQYWDKFYQKHCDQFFKDRKWLESEFPEVCEADERISALDEGAEPKRLTVFETGCGVGNTVFPLISSTKNAFVYCCDFSPEAIRLLKSRPQYSTERCHAFVGDLTDDDPSHWPLENESVDFIIMLFTLSAIRPEKMPAVIRLLVSFLKPGGYILFRDYGKYDLAQLRFKNTQCAGENLYIRQDGTLAYFFTQEQLRNLFIAEGMVEEQNAVDRRLLVNRKRNILMHRVWIQCKFRKP